MRIMVAIPGTSANLGPGYDIWGLALTLSNRFEASYEAPRSDSTANIVRVTHVIEDLVSVTADKPIALPEGDDNLLAKAYKKAFAHAGLIPLPMNVIARIGIPLQRGLGSSSTAILGGLLLANEGMRRHYQAALPLQDIFHLAVNMEGHPDNIAAALYGGWQLCIPDHSSNWSSVSLPVKAPFRIGGVIPQCPMATTDARNLVETSVDLKKVLFTSSRTALLTHLMGKPAWTGDDRELLRSSFDDVLHQNVRARLLPGMMETLQSWYEKGAYGAFLSGAGSTLLGIWPQDADIAALNLTGVLQSHSVPAVSFETAIDRTGAVISVVSDP